MPNFVPLVHALRGGRVESMHMGSYVVVQDGRVVDHAGDPARRTYYRSTSKPFQSMACILSGAADRFAFTPAMLAVAAGSHNAEPEQVACVQAMLAQAGLDEGTLGCGGHLSIDKEVQRAQIESTTAGDACPAVWSNCSGKHASMLASAVALDAPRSTYLDAAHPVQQGITETIAICAGVDAADIGLGIDGCGAPVHEVPLEAMAQSLCALAAPERLPELVAAAARRVVEAATLHPGMLAGQRRFDTDLMEAAAAPLLAKAGAEGVHGVAVPHLKLGLAIKVEDGSDRGYRQVVIELLRRHGALSASEADALSKRHGRTIKNHAGAEVGRLAVVI